MTGVLGLPAAQLLGEPYPWIMMPGFPGSGGFDDDEARRTTAVFTYQFEDGSRATVASPDLFAEAPSAHLYVLTERFRPSRAPGLKYEHVVEAMVPTMHAAEQAHPLNADDAELRAWLRRQGTRLFPGRTPVAVAVDWQQVAIDASGSKRVQSSERTFQTDL